MGKSTEGSSVLNSVSFEKSVIGRRFKKKKRGEKRKNVYGKHKKEKQNLRKEFCLEGESAFFSEFGSICLSKVSFGTETP